ncbi:MAG: protein phosphatase 2C domain-containing protein [Chloroflexales bacterium]|nr:protein phosphatase 2C domain-containing protein [Chloroflexales bacterium]
MAGLSITAPSDEGVLSHCGQVRQRNEDCYGSFHTVLSNPLTQHDAALLSRKGWLYVVADGMGGHESGGVASATAVQQICAAYYADPDDDPAVALRYALDQANSAIYAAAQASRRPTARPMGTTVVCAVIREQQLILAHVGDSRAYLLRNGALIRLTSDHDWVTGQMRMQGWSREEAEYRARQCGARGALLRAVGIHPQVEADLTTMNWQPGDVLLLCSDGLHGLVKDDQIARILRNQPAPRAARELIAAANAAGGHDNITALVVHGGAPCVPKAALPWWRRGVVLTMGLVLVSLLLLLGVLAPITNGRRLVNADTAINDDTGRGLAARPTMHPTATLQPTFQASSPPRARSAAPAVLAPSPTQKAQLRVQGGAGDLFRGVAYRGEPAGQTNGSCIQGRVIAANGSLFDTFYAQVDRNGTTVPAKHFYDTGNYRICGLAPGEWGVAIYAVNTVPISAAEQGKHQVRVVLEGAPGEIVYVNFQATVGLQQPTVTPTATVAAAAPSPESDAAALPSAVDTSTLVAPTAGVDAEADATPPESDAAALPSAVDTSTPVAPTP